MSDASCMYKHEKDLGSNVAAVSPATTTLKRNIGPLSIVGLGMSICNGCAAMSSTIVVGLSQGVGMGFITGMAISITLIYCVQELNAALASELPSLDIIVQATGSKACGTVLVVAFLLCLFVSANSVHQSTSRLIWSFARDNGLPFADKLTYLHPHSRVPILPLLLSGLGVTILGALYCASTTAYGSIISTCIILGNISFAIPATHILLRKREMKHNRWMRLGWLGGVSNVVTILFCLLTTVMWLFPLTPNPKPIDMNYRAAVLGGMDLLALLDFLFVRKSFHGPTSDELFAKILNVEVE
ncbi:hypothetical protein JCM10296v2_001219 [Rhodotorula toruloides]